MSVTKLRDKYGKVFKEKNVFIQPVFLTNIFLGKFNRFAPLIQNLKTYLKKHSGG